jgi:hypothetical protein
MATIEEMELHIRKNWNKISNADKKRLELVGVTE